MKHGDEHKATPLEILKNALGLFAGPTAEETLTTALHRLAYEQILLIEYLTEEHDAPLSDHIIQGVGQGIIERIRSLAALVETQMDVEWKGGAA